ncbi:ATP-dependent DNA helicase [Cupriavidus sp. WKF15]|uniref:ATP-dependent DNA helicase n=1 Tax=Cupriavidus sp. WKF15 TaxID=3032282 RepID=UPI0023E13D4E|nr:ATP-dependent DNA helicase [Cupriavidus sp. WKF15]WER49873.1 ATP-dependent DNA helicase [Cupriavidus sp. WKF15]
MSATPPDPLRYTVAVRTLCEFTAKAGDLDLRFTPSPTGQEGVAGHGVVTSRRGPGYESEVALSGEFEGLRVRGRADGYDPVANRIEEIKTVRGDKAEIPRNHQALHWAQAKIYGWLLCEARKLAQIDVALVYFDILSQRERVLKERCDAAALRAFFEDSCRRFMQWAEREIAHRSDRDAGLQALAFPHATFRDGQRLLAESVYKANASARTLLAQAPTGIGKSIGTVFPALKAMPTQRIDKIFFLSARSTGRAVALQATAQLRRRADDAPLRVLELMARDKACEHPDLACHGDSCPLAKGFYNRLPAARDAASHAALLDGHTVREIARTHEVCPYYLAQEMIRWSDLVVADYNYYFDRSAMLYALAALNEWRVSVLVDEAHNLVERGRAMYTATLDHAAFRGVRLSAPGTLKRDMNRVYRQWNALARSGEAAYETCDEEPAAFIEALARLCTAIIDDMSEHPQRHDVTLERFYFDAMHFLRLSEQMTEYGGKHSLFDITRAPRHRSGVDAALCVRNLLPAPYLAPRFAGAHSTTLFSATLQPADYYRNLLGVPGSAVWVEVPSPFQAEQLDVRVARHISTRYAHRQRSLPAIVALMADQFAQRPGNYLAFFSSHDYLQQAAALLAELHPGIPTWSQARGMTEAGQAAFLDAFAPGGRGIGFAVLGGVFSEGVDLPGDRLIGAFVATLGLPQVNPVNEQLRERMEAAFGAGHGYDYAYLYPGLRKVVQAAGRVIRTREDRGVVWLIDDRYARPEVQDMLPAWWKVPARKPQRRPADASVE